MNYHIFCIFNIPFKPFRKAGIFYQSQIYRSVYCSGIGIINYYYIIIISVYILLSAVFNTGISFCEDFTDYPKPPYDDRTCYEIMNESLDWDKPRIEIIDEHGSWIEHLPNGMVQCHWFPIEVSVKEVFKPVDVAILEDFSEGNSSVDNDSDASSDVVSENESKVVGQDFSPEASPHLRDPNIILKEFSEKVFAGKDGNEMIQISLDYVKATLPKDLWAKSDSEFNDPEHPIHYYMREFSSNCLKHTTTSEQKAAFLQYHASVSTSNVHYLYPDSKLEHVIQLFHYNVAEVQKYYNINFD
jgi:uncharacterized protein YodC (DUF2158 family)